MPEIIPGYYWDLINGQQVIRGTLIAVTDKEYEQFMNGDPINENQVSLTFFKSYLEDKGYNVDIATDKLSKAYAGEIGFWNKAYVISIPNLKEVLNAVAPEISYHEFIDAYCEYLKSI
jgi:hypothetical protein